MLPIIPNVIVMCVSVLGVHVKVVSSCSTYETPAFNLPTLRAAQGNALDWQVPVYPGIRYVLLVKVWTLLLVKVRTPVLPNVLNVENVWSMGQYYAKSVQILVLHIWKISFVIPMVILYSMLINNQLTTVIYLLRLYRYLSLLVLVDVVIICLAVLLCLSSCITIAHFLSSCISLIVPLMVEMVIRKLRMVICRSLQSRNYVALNVNTLLYFLTLYTLWTVRILEMFFSTRFR